MYPGSVANNVVFLSEPELTGMVEFPVISSVLFCCASAKSVAIVVATVLNGGSIFGVPALFWGLDVVAEVHNRDGFSWLCDMSRTAVPPACSISGRGALFWALGAVASVSACCSITCPCIMSRVIVLAAVLLSCSISGLGALFWDCCASILDFGAVGCCSVSFIFGLLSCSLSCDVLAVSSG